jgi:hypothetical protein
MKIMILLNDKIKRENLKKTKDSEDVLFGDMQTWTEMLSALSNIKKKQFMQIDDSILWQEHIIRELRKVIDPYSYVTQK